MLTHYNICVCVSMLYIVVYSGNPSDCAGDQDGDGVTDQQDACPYNRDIGKTHFYPHNSSIIATIDPGVNTLPMPQWSFGPLGTTISQPIAGRASMALSMYQTIIILELLLLLLSVFVGPHRFNCVDFIGTFRIDGSSSNYIGFVWSFQSIQKYYLALWNKESSYSIGRGVFAARGFHVKV